MAIIVTGAAGFIGSNVVKALNQRGTTDIVAVDNLTRADKVANLADCEIVDYQDKDAFIAAVREGRAREDVEAVLHQGACSDTMKSCGNRDSPAACNWLMFAANPKTHCVACRLNRTIPDLGDANNARYWRAIEAAKRRLVSQLVAMGLPVRSKIHDDPEKGVMFDFLRASPGGPQVMTGHASGLITLNVEEADDAKREAIRHAMREPYRTLLGHFRHEIGHYYWDRLVWDTRWLEPFRQLFGDERASYAEALKRNYEQGPPAGWAQSYITSYATMHPWEDWAETWAHYMPKNLRLRYGLERCSRYVRR